MPETTPEYAYVEGQWRDAFPAMLADYVRRGRQLVEDGPCELDVRYGPQSREVFDFFPACGTERGAVVYFHAGYWQGRDKADFRFLAPAFTRLGLHAVFVNYPLCPEVTLFELLDSARRAVPAIRAYLSGVQRMAGGGSGSSPDALPLIAAGHSAGAHIAIELALARPAPGIAAVLALSGIYDLVPLVATTLNRNLRLDAGTARALSPRFRVAAGCAPALFAVGANETAAFRAQTRSMHESWLAAGNRSALEVVDGADHFSLLVELLAPASRLSGCLDALPMTGSGAGKPGSAGS